MARSAVEPRSFNLSAVERKLCRMGDLSWMLDQHQIDLIYDPYRKWEKNRAKTKGGASRIWMLDAGRQVGKTFTIDLIKIEDCLRGHKHRHLLASAEEVALKEFVLPNIEAIIGNIPDDVKPKFLQHHKGMKAAYYFPVGESVLKLVGIDKNPDGLRGPKLHGGGISEAAFVRKLRKVIGSILYPQLIRVDESTLILESSAPSEPDHDFDVIFRPDCIKRKAYIFLTIHENTALTEEIKTEFLEAAIAIDPDDAQREYLGVRIRNRRTAVFPEFNRERHWIENYKLPKHGLAITTLDPGQVHMFAVTFSVFDTDLDQIVFIDGWAEPNASTEKVAAIVAAREYDLWGTWPAELLSRIPLDDEDNGALGWRTLLADDRCFQHAEQLWELAQKPERERYEYGRHVRYIKPVDQFHWYDQDERVHRLNPVARVSDTSLQLINDLTNIYGLQVAPTTKGDLKREMVQLGRSMLSQNKATFAMHGKVVADHVYACEWNALRTKFAEHAIYGHFDLAACFVYGVRAWPTYWNQLPTPPHDLYLISQDDIVGDVSWRESEHFSLMGDDDE